MAEDFEDEEEGEEDEDGAGMDMETFVDWLWDQRDSDIIEVDVEYEDLDGYDSIWGSR